MRRPWGARGPYDLPISKQFPTGVIYAIGVTDAVARHLTTNRFIATIDFGLPPDPFYSLNPARRLPWLQIAPNMSISWMQARNTSACPDCIDIWIRRGGWGWFGIGVGGSDTC